MCSLPRPVVWWLVLPGLGAWRGTADLGAPGRLSSDWTQSQPPDSQPRSCPLGFRNRL